MADLNLPLSLERLAEKAEEHVKNTGWAAVKTVVDQDPEIREIVAELDELARLLTPYAGKTLGLRRRLQAPATGGATLVQATETVRRNTRVVVDWDIDVDGQVRAKTGYRHMIRGDYRVGGLDECVEHIRIELRQSREGLEQTLEQARTRHGDAINA